MFCGLLAVCWMRVVVVVVSVSVLFLRLFLVGGSCLSCLVRVAGLVGVRVKKGGDKR